MAFAITHSWDTGDINTRNTQACAVIDRDHDGTPHIIAPIQHGVRCFAPTGGAYEWTYSGISNGYDVRDIAVGDLNGTGYNDCTVVAAGYYNTPSTRGQWSILNKDGTALQEFTVGSFSIAPTRCYAIAIDGTDIYIGTDVSITKFTKSGSTWSEDTTHWAKALSGVVNIIIEDMGNGKRIYVLAKTARLLRCYQTDGTLDWSVDPGNTYLRDLAFGVFDSTKTGKQIAVPYQSGLKIYDKDGNVCATITTGTNVYQSVIAYDCDGDGEDEFYYSDMGRHVYCFERTGINTYSQKYILTNAINASQYAGLSRHDINEDGDDEIFIETTDGHCLIYDKTLATQIADLNIAHGQVGGFYESQSGWKGNSKQTNGVVFADCDNDGHDDLVITGATGYVDIFLVSGIVPPGQTLTTATETDNAQTLAAKKMAVAAVATTTDSAQVVSVSKQIAVSEAITADPAQILNSKMMSSNNTSFVQAWYGEFKLPNSTIATSNASGSANNNVNNPYKDGYIGVIFDIKCIDTNGFTLSYNTSDKLASSQTNTTQWDYEGYMNFKTPGAAANILKYQLEKDMWNIDNDMYQKVKGTVVLFDLDNRAANDFE